MAPHKPRHARHAAVRVARLGTHVTQVWPQVYVTHRLRELGPQVWPLLQRGARVYVAGSAQKMPADVLASLEAVAAQHGGLGEEGARQWVRQLELTQRYCVEAWS